jgi:putative ABC transport system permease protein
MSYIRSKDLGYSKDHVIIVPIDKQVLNKYDLIKALVKQVPGVKNVSGAYGIPTSIQWGDGITANNGTEPVNISVKAIPADLDFIQTMGMHLVAGTDFAASDVQLMDTSNNGANLKYSYILNETAVQRIGWTPEEAIGKTIDKGVPGTVKAVVKDFHFSSMHEPIGPLVMLLDKSFVRNVFVELGSDNIPAAINRLESVWKETVPNRPFTYRFMDEDYENLYKKERRTANVFSAAAGLAILLACLGLFGLAAFTTMQRTKEIGIRKVLGAGILDIAGLLSKDILLLILYALVIATPLACIAANQWLQDFAYRINIEAWVFFAAGIGVVVIALATVSYHAIRAAMMNPVKSLRVE